MSTVDRERHAKVLPHNATGTWCLTSQSGTRHLLRLLPGTAPVAARLPDLTTGHAMRGDHHDLLLLTWYAQRDDDGAMPDLTIGDCLVMVLEPLSPHAQLTVRLTSPIVAIEQLAPDHEVPR